MKTPDHTPGDNAAGRMKLFRPITKSARPLLAKWHVLPIGVLATGVILLVAALYFIIVGLQRDTGQFRAEYRDNGPWYAGQFERELSSFTQTLDAYHLGHAAATKEDVIDRFDVFWSRIDNADAGAVGSLYLRFEGAEALLEEAKRALRDIEATVMSLEPGDAAAHGLIEDRLDGLAGAFHEISLLALHRQNLEVAGLYDRMGQAHEKLKVILAGVLAGGAILIGLILVEIRQIDSLRSSLERRVQQRTRDLREEIMQHHQAVEALQDSEARFRDFAQSASDWFWELDPGLSFSYLSERFQGVTGIPSEQVLGKPIDKVGTPDTRDEVWIKNVEDINAGLPFRDFRLVLMRPDGTPVHVSLSGTPRRDEAGKHLGYRGTGANITGQVEAERALRRSEERYRRLVDLSPDGILIHVQDRIVFANPAAVRFLGAAKGDDLIGRNLLEFIDAKFHKSTKLRIKEAIDKGREQPQVKQVFIGLDGRSFPVHCASTRLPREEGRTVLTMFRDISQVTQIEDPAEPAS